MFTTHFLVLLKAQQLSATSSNKILDKLYIATAPIQMGAVVVLYVVLFIKVIKVINDLKIFSDSNDLNEIGYCTKGKKLPFDYFRIVIYFL